MEKGDAALRLEESALLKITVLASGSKGNATLVETAATRFVIDSGLSRREFDRRLVSVGLGPEDLDAQVVTHLHGDHVGSATVTLCLANTVPIYIHGDNVPYLIDRFRKLDSPTGRTRIKPFAFGPFAIGDCTVTPFEVPHDIEANTCGLRIEVQSDRARSRFTYATDLGHFPDELVQWFDGCGAMLLEFNHDPKMLWASARPERVKDRIYGSSGHLSNVQAAQALREILAEAGGSVETVLLGHVSAECNSDQRILAELNEALGPDLARDLSFVFARQSEVTSPVTVEGKAYAC